MYPCVRTVGKVHRKDKVFPCVKVVKDVLSPTVSCHVETEIVDVVAAAAPASKMHSHKLFQRFKSNAYIAVSNLIKFIGQS